ncbi:hypothetical protein ABPG74_012614 [Tetrahymena malaccensis]
MINSSLEDFQNLDYENSNEFIIQMSNKGLEENDFIQIKEAILKFKKLESLEMNLSCNIIDFDASYLLSQAFTEGGLNLRNIYLNLKGIYFKTEDFKDLTLGMSKCNLLTSLNFEFPILENQTAGIDNFSKMVQKLNKLENLSLNLTYYLVERIALRYISEAISKCQHLKSLSLDFDNSLLVNCELLNIVLDLKQLQHISTLSFQFSGHQQQENFLKAKQICYKFKKLTKLYLCQ